MTTVTGPLIASPDTPHTAKRIAIRYGRREFWRASWCPAKSLDRYQAFAAVEIARYARPGQTVTAEVAEALDVLAQTLGYTWRDAAELIAKPPHVLDCRFHTMTLSCWCEPATALDGHREPDGSDPAFAATGADPIAANGFLMDVLS